MKRTNHIVFLISLVIVSVALSRGRAGTGIEVVQPTLIERGSTPFYLQAVITERSDPNEHVDIEMSWLALHKWRRTIRSQEFSQTLIVNGEKVFEQDSDDYFPLGIQVLATAMVDPRPILDALRPGDPVRTKANGLSDESGRVCFSPNSKMCMTTRNGLSEFLGAPGRSVDFLDYRKFQGKRVARQLIYHIDAGDSLQERITTLGKLESDEKAFAISEATPKDKQIRSVILPESELRELALQPIEIIWPQVLEDNQTTGDTSYYVSVDRSGQVREVFPLSVAVERADDSARRQIMKLRFKPVIRDGVAVQGEAILSFHFNTRQYGPAVPLTNEEVRKLASHVIEPTFPSGATPGATYSLWVAVDDEGHVIEMIAGEGPHELSQTCFQAVGKWHFAPILQSGKPRPYRAQVTFRVPTPADVSAR
jgi:hypothetical protein